MRSLVLRILYGIAVFIITVIILEMLPAGELSDVTAAMPEASFPLVRIDESGFEEQGVYFNELHGFASERELADFIPCITPVGPDRTVRFKAYNYARTGGNINSISFAVRSPDGARLIQEGDLPFTAVQEDLVAGELTLGSLIHDDEDYILVIKLTMLGVSSSESLLEESPEIYYYTRIRCSDGNDGYERRLGFALNFHREAISGDPGGTLDRYLETNEQGKNDSPYHVSIHSSSDLIDYRGFEMSEAMPCAVTLEDLQDNTACIRMDSLLTDGENEYLVNERMLVRNGTERFFLMDYDRTMQQISGTDAAGYEDGEARLGIADPDMEISMSSDGSIAVFENAGRLIAVNTSEQTSAYVYGFISEKEPDRRELYNAHSFRVLNVGESGLITFLVTGYMNRGRHEGETGILMMTYNSLYRTLEEKFFMPYKGSAEALMAMAESGVYLNSRGLLYLYIGEKLYQIDAERRTVLPASLDSENSSVVCMSKSGRYAAALPGGDAAEDAADGRKIIVADLSDMSRYEIECDDTQELVLYGFIQDDLVYGYARKADEGQDMMGRQVKPVCRLCIAACSHPTGSSFSVDVLNDYRPSSGFIQNVETGEGALTLWLMEYAEDTGYYTLSGTERILNASGTGTDNTVQASSGGIVSVPLKNLKKGRMRYVQPREIVLIEKRTLPCPENVFAEGTLFVYGSKGYEGIYTVLSEAVRAADECMGRVTDSGRRILFRYAGKNIKEQIMAIQVPSSEGNGSIAMSVNTVLDYELGRDENGQHRDASYLIDRGEEITAVLQELLPGRTVADLTGCTLDQVLYMVDKQMPVIARCGEADALVITGYNSEQLVVAVPGEPAVRFMNMREADEMFSLYGSEYISYFRTAAGD
ncbi:MAG: hypothetical protein IJ930_11075 [Lachnospiraceae bacterium]|nr:hypothetical protein [Lachnospiraceae bacterium]